MPRWLYNFLVEKIKNRVTGKIEISLFDGGIANVEFKQSFKAPKETGALDLV